MARSSVGLFIGGLPGEAVGGDAEAGECPGPEFFDAVEGAVHAEGDFWEGEPFEMAEDDGFSIVSGEGSEGVGEEDALFAARQGGAGGGVLDEAFVECVGGVVEFLVEFLLEGDLPLLGAVELAGHVGEAGREDLAEPGEQFRLGLATELAEVAGGPEAGFLDRVGGV